MNHLQDFMAATVDWIGQATKYRTPAVVAPLMIGLMTGAKDFNICADKALVKAYSAASPPDTWAVIVPKKRSPI